MKHFEVNYDGLVGPTHNYAGLSFGNVASVNNAHAVSNPRQAAKQGLQKMKALHDLGLKQGVLAPQARPDVTTLRRLGFTGSDAEVLTKAATQSPQLLHTVSSASSMWTANAATVSPSADTTDGRVHFTPANLVNKLHRSLEPTTTGRILQAIFKDDRYFFHHSHLPEHETFGDEGAANHTRLCSQYGHAGVEMFVYGRSAFDHQQPAPQRYPARQTLEASQAVARLHGLTEETAVFAQQNPAVIDAGVFHNDVICVGNQNVLFFHEKAFADKQAVLTELRSKFENEMPLHFIEVPDEQVSVADAIQTYLFNTQLVSLVPGEMTLIAPTDCQENVRVADYLSTLVGLGTPIRDVQFFDVKQSMRNGGGPACLRLRVALNDVELEASNQHCLLDDELFARLNKWIDSHYRDQLAVDDLRDIALWQESQQALDELTHILRLGSIYDFQRWA